MKPFHEMTYSDAVALFGLKKRERGVADAYDVIRAMAENHDFWQDGDLWVGPRGQSDAEWQSRMKAAVERQHVSGGAVLEAQANFVRGLLGKQANIQVVPIGDHDEKGPEWERLTKEAEGIVEALSVWWDDVGLWAAVRRMAARSRWAGWGTLRLRIPSGRLVERETRDGVIQQLPTNMQSLADALAAIELSAPEPEHCVVVKHPDTQQHAAVFHFTGNDENGRAVNYIELWYDETIRGETYTMRRTLRQEGQDEGPFSYRWDGRLPVSEMDASTLFTRPVREAEAAYAFALTNVVKVGESAGYRQHVTTNAEEPGYWSYVKPAGEGPHETADDGQGKTIYKHRVPWAHGPGTTNNIIGIPAKTDDSGETIASPGFHVVDPVDPELATKAADFWRRTVLEKCYQGHLAGRATGEASGLAYEQARAAFAGDLQLHVDPAERAITQALESVIVIAESMMASPPKILERFRLIVTLTPDAGPISPERRKQIVEEVNAGLKARPTAMAELGTDDVAAELDAIDQDPISQLSMTERRAKAMAAFPDEVPLVTRAILVGYTEEEARQYFGEADAARVRAEEQARDEIRDALERGTGEGAAA